MTHETTTTSRVVRIKDYDGMTKAHHSFGAKDRHGRVVGARIYRFMVDCQPYDPDSERRMSFWAGTPGLYFAFCPHATRNGVDYGASQTDQLFATEALREAAIAAYLKKAAKRATSK